MKISINNLRKIIRETIEEIATPGDYRYGNARGGVQSGGMSGGEPQFMQPGIDSSNMAPQGVGGAGKQYAAGQGSQSSVASDDPGYSDSLDSSSKFLLTIESNVLKGKNGQVSYFNGNVYSVDSSSDKSSQDFANLFHTWDKKSSSDLASSVIKILMQHDFIEESPVPVELLDEIGVRTTSGNVMEIVEYFSEYNNGYIARNETRQRRGRRL